MGGLPLEPQLQWAAGKNALPWDCWRTTQFSQFAWSLACHQFLHTANAQCLHVEGWNAIIPFKNLRDVCNSSVEQYDGRYFINMIKWCNGLDGNVVHDGLWKMTDWTCVCLLVWSMNYFPRLRVIGHLPFYVTGHFLPQPQAGRSVHSAQEGFLRIPGTRCRLSSQGVAKRPLNLPGSHGRSLQGEEHFHGGFWTSSA